MSVYPNGFKDFCYAFARDDFASSRPIPTTT